MSLFRRIFCTWFQGLDGHRCCVVPYALPDLPELAVAQLSDELEAVPIDLPLVASVVRQVGSDWLVHLNSRKNF